MLIGKAKEAGDTAEAERLVNQYRHWYDATFKPEKQRLDCDRKGEIASDIQRMILFKSILLTYLLSKKSLCDFNPDTPGCSAGTAPHIKTTNTAGYLNIEILRNHFFNFIAGHSL